MFSLIRNLQLPPPPYNPHLFRRVFIWYFCLIFFSVQVKSGTCYITGQWGRIQNNKRNLTLTITLTLNPNYLLLFFNVCFYHDFYGFIIFTAYSRLIFYMWRQCQLDSMPGCNYGRFQSLISKFSSYSTTSIFVTEDLITNRTSR